MRSTRTSGCDRRRRRDEYAIKWHESNWLPPPPKPKPQAEKSAAPKIGRMQRMREIEANPLVQSCIEQFDAKIDRFDMPKN